MDDGLIKDDLDRRVRVELGGSGGGIELDDLRRSAEAAGQQDGRGDEGDAERYDPEPERAVTRTQYGRERAVSTSIADAAPAPLLTSIRAVLSVAILATPAAAVLSAGLD